MLTPRTLIKIFVRPYDFELPYEHIYNNAHKNIYRL
jgi:hypothetical protein